MFDLQFLQNSLLVFHNRDRQKMGPLDLCHQEILGSHTDNQGHFELFHSFLRFGKDLTPHKLQEKIIAMNWQSVLPATKAQAKSLQRSCAVGDFYGTGIEIWAGFGPVRQLLRPVFSCFHGQKKIKNIVDGENIFDIE